MDEGAVMMVHRFEHALRLAKDAKGLGRQYWENQCKRFSEKLKCEYGIDARYSLDEEGGD